MSRKPENGLFDALEKILREQERAMTCNELFDIPEVREHAASANRVSDYLGALWRKGSVVRLPAPPSGKDRARWAYQWKTNRTDTPIGAVLHTAKILIERPHMIVSEEGKTIQIEFPNLTILVKAH